MFLQFGKQRGLETHVLTLTSTQLNVTNFWGFPSVRVELKGTSTLEFFSFVVYYLLACIILRDLSDDDTLLALEPDPIFALILVHEAQMAGVQTVLLTTSVPQSSESENLKWKYVHPLTPNHELLTVLPTQISSFVDLSKGDSIGVRLKSALSNRCRIDCAGTLFSDRAGAPPTSKFANLQRRLYHAANAAVRSAAAAIQRKEISTLPCIPITSLMESKWKPDTALVIDWTKCSQAFIRIRPMASQISFSKHRTYWFAGLSGGLGLALCEWMARRGANHFVISSRNPKIDNSWVENMTKLGVIVKIASW